MGSGSFPQQKTLYADGRVSIDPGHSFLKGIIEKLEKFREEWHDSVYSGDSGGGQFDNAASDGAYLEDIDVAVMLLKKCITTMTWKADGTYEYKNGE